MVSVIDRMINISSFAFLGIDVKDVDVQVHISSGLPSFTIVGLADKIIAESKERVRAALSSIGIAMPPKKILVNLAPADLIKEGSHFDLAIACGILSCLSILPQDELNNYFIIGELALDSSILSVSGTLPAAIGAVARDKGLICSIKNSNEATWSGSNNILAANNLLELINHFKGIQILSHHISSDQKFYKKKQYQDMSDIKGQKVAKRALEIAAAGSHNIMMYGPPGSGKSMLAQRIMGILPEMSSKEILECNMIASVADMLYNGELVLDRPFRNPHHTCSSIGMVGGGRGMRIKPGEISLAHNGVLFLDEFPEFPQTVREVLRQPMESNEITISRANLNIKYPANFQLVAAMNPCKCGYFGDNEKQCNKAPKCAKDYQMKISGPILDRFDLTVEVARNNIYEDNHLETIDESSEEIAKRVQIARNIQIERYKGYDILTNSCLDGNMLIEYAFPSDNDGIEMLKQVTTKFKLSMRAHNRILRVARTIADIENSERVFKRHIAEAIHYRNINL